MGRQVSILVPVSEDSGSKLLLAPRLDTLAGKRIGIINNGWRCMHLAADELRRLLREQGVSDLVEKRTTAARPVLQSDLMDLARTADGVICGIGN